MPRFDQTGPMGLGPLTGRGRGKCAGAQEFVGDAYYGRPRRFARGRGCYPYYYGEPVVSSKEFLQQEKEMLTKRLALIDEALAKEDKK